MIIQMIKTMDRGKCRPALLKTGKFGRPRKVYQLGETPELEVFV